jgi:ligand-binding sensor domain-containing protein
MLEYTPSEVLMYRLGITIGALCIVLFAFSTDSSSAQSQDWVIFEVGGQYLPDGNVTALAQDSLGFIWIGTEWGLAKYRNYSWYNDFSGPKFICYKINCLHVDWKGTVWIGGGGLMGIDAPVHELLPAQTILSVTECVQVVSDKANSEIWYAGRDTLWRWDGWVSSPIKTSDSTGYHIRTFILMSDNSKIVVYENSDSTSRIYRYKNGAWELLKEMDKYHVNCVAEDSGRVLLGSNRGLHIYDFASDTYVSVPGAPAINTRALCVSGDGSQLWVGTTKGVALRKNGVWTMFTTHNSPMPDSVVNTIIMDRAGNTWIGTGYGLAIYREGGPIMSADAPARIPGDIAIHSVYPSPASTSVNVSVDIARASSIRLEVVDVMGRTIARQADGCFSSGPHQFTWNLADTKGVSVANGSYFFRLVTNNKVIVKPVSVVR